MMKTKITKAITINRTLNLGNEETELIFCFRTSFKESSDYNEAGIIDLAEFVPFYDALKVFAMIYRI